MKSGIYKITNTVNGKCYVGSAVNVRRRWDEHRRGLRKGKHHSVVMQRAWEKYGEPAFVFSVVLYCDKANLLFYEQLAMDVLTPEYNISPTAGNCLGLRHTDEARANMSRAAIGKKISLATRARMRSMLIGHTRSRGIKWTREARSRHSIAMLVKHNACPPIVRAAASAANRGRVRTVEWELKKSIAKRLTHIFNDYTPPPSPASRYTVA